MANRTNGEGATTSGGRAGFYERWLSPEGYLGLHLVAGFALALAAGWVFDFVEDWVFGSSTTIAADARAQALAQYFQTPGLTRVALAVSFLGNSPTVAVLTVVVAAVLFRLRSHRRLYMFLATMIGGSLLNVALKLYFHRARPTEFPRLTTAHGYSFPSGHSMGSMLFYGSLAYVVYFTIERHRAWRVAAVAACLTLVVLVGGSRVYLGVHYLSDVVAGFAAGLFWICVCLSGTEAWVRIRDWRRGRRAPEEGTTAGG
jgi:membrane-associated phospholipid phosphatase